jgi:hypothetical protein
MVQRLFFVGLATGVTLGGGWLILLDQIHCWLHDCEVDMILINIIIVIQLALAGLFVLMLGDGYFLKMALTFVGCLFMGLGLLYLIDRVRARSRKD